VEGSSGHAAIDQMASERMLGYRGVVHFLSVNQSTRIPNHSLGFEDLKIEYLSHDFVSPISFRSRKYNLI